MKLHHCIECSEPLLHQTATEYVCTNGHAYFNNPKATVAVVLMHGSNILTTKRAFEPGKGLYSLPGGFLEYAEDPYDAAKREIAEETGIDFTSVKYTILDAYTDHYIENITVCELIMLAEDWHGVPTPADDSAALEWQPLSFIESDAFYPNYTRLRKILEDRL